MSSNPQVSNIVIAPIDASAQNPDIAFGGVPNSGTGIRGTFGEINISIDGLDVAQLNPSGLVLSQPLALAPQVLILNGSGDPVNGTTGLDIAGPGSLYIDSSAGVLWINTAASSSPVWVKVGTQS